MFSIVPDGKGEITSKYVEKYLYSILPREEPILRKMEEEAKERGIPVVGPLVGRVLFLVAKILKARMVLEIGTAIGYSATWLGMAVKENEGKVKTIEVRNEMVKEARRNLKDVGLDDFIEVIHGDALKLLPKIRERFDMIFLDAEKENYPDYLKLLLPSLNHGGVLMADNCLWGGSVPAGSKEPSTEALRKFNSAIFKNNELFSVILPVRDGISISWKF